MTTTQPDQADHAVADQLNERIIALRTKHERRTSVEARAISHDAITLWGQPVRAALALDPIDIAREYGARWRADAAAAITVQDWRAFGDRGRFIVLDFEELGIDEPKILGFATGEHLQTIARDRIAARKPAEAVAVNTTAITDELHRLLKNSHETVTSESLTKYAAALVFGVVAHERAHVLEHYGKGSALKEKHTLAYVAKELPTSLNKTTRWRTHRSQWLRAYCHIVSRTPNTFLGEAAHAYLADDLQGLQLGEADDFKAALADEIREAGDCRIVDALQKPAPKLFLDLFAERSAARERGAHNVRNAA